MNLVGHEGLQYLDMGRWRRIATNICSSCISLNHLGQLCLCLFVFAFAENKNLID